MKAALWPFEIIGCTCHGLDPKACENVVARRAVAFETRVNGDYLSATFDDRIPAKTVRNLPLGCFLPAKCAGDRAFGRGQTTLAAVKGAGLAKDYRLKFDSKSSNYRQKEGVELQ
jgi:hypothetical protein